MPEITRSRDCVLFFKGDAYTVTVSQAMVQGGWAGGSGVQWVDSPSDERMVTYSSGLYGGIAVWGSDESADRFTAMTRNGIVYQQTVLIAGGSLISTSSYERYTWASRMAGGPFVPLVYQPNDVLFLSLRGLWTKEDELTLSADPRAPAFFAGFVSQVPKPQNDLFLGIQTSM
jgi:hypothetical protein